MSDARPLLVRGAVVAPHVVHDDVVVEVAGGVIRDVRRPRPDDPAPSDHTVLPGLVDLHCHGGGGASFTAADAEQVEIAALHHRARGTTSLLASTVTDASETMLAVVAALADAADGGLLAGIHLEGPFLSRARCGAQDPRHLRAPDVALLHELLAAGRGHVRVVTLAPELAGADELAAVLDEHGVVAAAGHTDADADVVRRFLAARPDRRRLVTHLFNGMPLVHHRAPGPALAALALAARGEAVVEVVADGVHVHDDTVAAVLDIAPGATALVTDATAAAGRPDGQHVLGPQTVTVTGGVARLADGVTLAGGTSRLLDVVRRQVAAGRVARHVVAAATLVPAEVLGLPAGLLDVGAPADLLVVDADWQLVRVMAGGSWVA